MLFRSYLGDVNVSSNGVLHATQDKQFALLATWIIFCRNRDKDWLKTVYKRLRKTYEPNGELVVASWQDMNEVSYKMPDSPAKRNEKKEDVYSLDMSCIKLLNMELLERMAIICNDSFLSNYATAKNELRKKINDTLYNESLGIYMNKYVGGSF